MTDHLPYAVLRAAPGTPAVAMSRPATQERQRHILAAASQIYAPDVEVEMRARVQAFRDKWAEQEPQAVAALMDDFEQPLSSRSVDFPRAYVSLLRTTHLLDRFHQEARRKQGDMGMLQSEAGCDVLWYEEDTTQRLNLPYDVPANAFMTMAGGKFSKRHNRAVWLHDLLAQYDPDVIRYYVASVLPETDDTDFVWGELVRRTNDELVAAWGNLVHRVLSFAVQHWQSRVPAPGDFAAADHAMLDRISQGFATIGRLIEAVKLRAALREAMGLVRAVNGYLTHAPWFGVVKDDATRAGTTVYAALQAIYWLNVLLAPFLPFSAERVHRALGYEQPLFGTQHIVTYTESARTHEALVYEAATASGRWAPSAIPPGQRLVWSSPLYKKLDR